MGSDQLAASADRTTFFNTARESQSETIWLSPIHISTKQLASAIENCQLGEEWWEVYLLLTATVKNGFVEVYQC